MPDSPNQTGCYSRYRKGQKSFQTWLQEALPANLFIAACQKSRHEKKQSNPEGAKTRQERAPKDYGKGIKNRQNQEMDPSPFSGQSNRSQELLERFS